MLSNTKHVLDKSVPIKTENQEKDSEFGFVFQRKTRSLLENVNTEILSDSVARFGHQSTLTSAAFSQTHE